MLTAERDEPGTAPILVVVYTKDQGLLGRRFVLDRSSVLVGRGANSDIVMQDPSVSPEHAHFEEQEAAWWCVEDGSTLSMTQPPSTSRATLTWRVARPRGCANRPGLGERSG